MSECNRPLEAPFGVFRKFAWSSCGVLGAFLHLSRLQRWKIEFDEANPSTFESLARSNSIVFPLVYHSVFISIFTESSVFHHSVLADFAYENKNTHKKFLSLWILQD